MTAGGPVISGLRISHGHASVEVREATGVESQRETAADLLAMPAVEEALVLRTCNRIEAYVVGPGPDPSQAVRELVIGDARAGAARDMDHETSIRHLLRVAAGLESVVLGEDQILGQVRDAFEDARSVGAIGPVLEAAVTKAIRVGERARTETDINEGVVSLASAAVRMAEETTGLDGATALVVGAGEMGTVAAEALAEEVDRLLVANRTVPHAEHVVETVSGTVASEAAAVGLEALPTVVEQADVVVSATGSEEYVFSPGAVRSAGETLVIDLAQPRDLPPSVSSSPDITLHDLDTLEAVTEKTRRRRRAAAAAVEEIVEEEHERLLAQYKRKRADRVISAMYESADCIKTMELQTARSKLDLDEEEEAVLEAMADSIVSKLLAPPTSSLRDAAEDDDWSTIHTALELFDPEFGPEPGDLAPAGDTAAEDIPPEIREEVPKPVLDRLGED